MKKELPTGAAYKEAKIKSKLNSLENVMQAISEKQDDFHIDDSFEIFENSFSTFEKKNLLKLMFTHFFNADFKRINELGNIEEFVTERGSRDPRGRRERQRGDRRDRSRDRNDRGPGRRERRGRYGGSDSVRIFMNQGKSDGVGLHLLLGQLANQAGIKRDNVNNVELKDRFSFFDVPSKAGKKKLVGFKGFKLHEKEARFELSK